MKVAVIRTGVANLASVVSALRLAGADPIPTDDAALVREARAVVLPGVGAFGPAMRRLDSTGLAAAMRARIAAGAATLGVCLGMQLLLEGSDEAPGVAGLAIVPGRAERFPSRVRVPQLGWNRVSVPEPARLLREGHAYFANSYRLAVAPAGFTCGLAEHGGTFVASIERGAVLACQFHPELSGAFGLDLLRRWLACAREAVPC